MPDTKNIYKKVQQNLAELINPEKTAGPDH